MNKELEKIRKRSTEIMGDYPAQREELLNKLSEAENNRRQAKAALDAAEDLETYDSTAEVLKRAELAYKFAKSALAKLDAAPRMNEDEYMVALNTCRSLMNDAANNYRVKAAALMDQLKALTDEYKQIAEDTNSTLVNLDKAANVLQSKYPYRVKHFQGMPDQKTPDNNAWVDYALRYEGFTACRLVTEIAGTPHHDSVLAAAWNAVNKGYPRRNF